MQIEYPFLRYNLFYYIYVLSCFEHAGKDKRFQAALDSFESTLDEDGNVKVERPRRNLGKLGFCAKSKASQAATVCYR